MPLGSKLIPPWGSQFYIELYKENSKRLLEPLMGIWPNSTGMVPGWSLTEIVQMVLIGLISRSRVLYQSCSNYPPGVEIDLAPGITIYIELYKDYSMGTNVRGGGIYVQVVNWQRKNCPLPAKIAGKQMPGQIIAHIPSTMCESRFNTWCRYVY